nr:EOG090X09BQ [Sida crystallina]
MGKCVGFAGINQIRNYKSEFNLEWVPPPKVKCTDPSKSGDRSANPDVDLSRPMLHFDMLDELKTFSPTVQKLASLEFATEKEKIQVILQDTLKKVQRHPMDVSSIESTVAALTVRIRHCQKTILKHPYNVIHRHSLKELIEKRKSHLKHLRRMDYKRFEWLLEKLDLVFHANMNPVEVVTRKGALRKLTTYYCNSVREKRLEAYRKELEAQKAAFALEKTQLLEWIEKEEEELGLKA